MEESLIHNGLQTRSPNSMSQARYHDTMKICAHLKNLNVYRNLERPLQFLEDIWNAFY